MINFNKDPLPNFTKSTNRDFAKKDTNFKKFPKKDYKGKAFNKQPKKGSYKKPFKKGKHQFFKKPKKKLIKKIRTPEERKLAKERRKQRKLARRRQKFWYRNLPKVHKKWLRFSYNIKKVANPRLAIWAPFFQKDNSLRSLFLFRELTLTPVLWEQPKDWKNVFRIALFYRKLGLITRVNFDN